ncbi:Ribonuclease H-like protein [Mycena chlorophos]|uniref:ribonuclease H n=1 Tax=Mycena chlorophos TaxID=658473 RepID=A0A8H6SI96_MYCCL|nr:Ribonuclease H-like protein [Mycena chlorophos]
MDELIESCEYCGRYYMLCCQHPSWRTGRACHHYPVVRVDGACLRNGRPNAEAGIGCALGDEAEGPEAEKHHISRVVTERMDPGKTRTSQRAELLAALYGLDLLVNAERCEGDSDALVCVVAADSEYVVKGITEWLPRWKENGWRKNDGTVPANLDLFRRLDDKISRYEARGMDVQLFRIPRAMNEVADGLAKDAAARANVAL